MSGLNDCMENQRILRKLPDWVVTRWSRIAQQDRSANAYPGFAAFSDFMAQEAKVASDPIASVQALRGKTNDTNDSKPKDTSKASKKVKSKSLNTSSQETQETKKSDNSSKSMKKQSDQTQKSDPKKTPNKGPVVSSSGNQKQDKKVSRRNCYYCSEKHFLSRRKEFRKLTPKDRIQFLRDGHMCFRYLGKGHSTEDCQRTMITCVVCHEGHNSPAHTDSGQSFDNTVLKSSAAMPGKNPQADPFYPISPESSQVHASSSGE